MIDRVQTRSLQMDMAHAAAAGSVVGITPARVDASVVRAAEAVSDPIARAWQPQAVQAAGVPLQARVAGSPVHQASAPDVVTLAELSKAAYAEGAPLPSGWREASTAELRSIGVRPTDLASPTSAFRAHVYVTGEGASERFVVAFRGSTSDRSDWISNGAQAAGFKTDHYNRALVIGDRIARSGADNVTIAGHSLGGGLASAAAIAAGRDAVTFNAAGLSGNTIRDARAVASAAGAAPTSKIQAYYVRGEILSALQDGGDRVAGALIGGLITRSWTGARFGAQHVDAPEAFGTRIALNAERPDGMRWYQDHPVSRHGIDYVLSSLHAR